MDIRFALLLVCFFVSGFAALLYQTAWTREFAFLFGTSELAVVAVLAAYMGGLAFGAAVAARFVRRLTRPVLAYGLLELGIAVCALLVPTGIRFVQSVYLSIAGGLDAPPETMALTTALFHLIGSFVVLVPCTALMGATLPLLARYAVSDDAQVGPRIGVLYAVNTFGAIAGTLVAAFFLLPEFGLRQTVYIGIAGNAVVFLAAATLARGLTGLATEQADAHTRTPFHWILPAMTISGAVSFTYEVLWTRLLGHVLGGSTAAFASMLASFLLGIALGSAAASRFARTRESARAGFILSQLGIGVLAWIAFRLTDSLPQLAAAVGASPTSPAPGAAAAGILLLPVTLCIGATFPFGVRILARDAEDAAAVSGRVYAWNTLGSIIGAILTGFFLLPLLGLENTAMVGVTASLLLALLAASLSVPRRQVFGGITAALLLFVLIIGLPRPENLLLNSAMNGGRMPGEIFYLGVGRSATVTVVEHTSGWRVLTNGLPESGVDRKGVPDTSFNETAWLSLLPTAARPTAERMLIIGFGAGQTVDAVADAVVEIDVVELEEEVIVANRMIPREVDPLDDPRVNLILGDARGAMTLSDARYDAIVSQPSHPWTSGASHLYTREFFELTHSKLESDGIFIQWIGVNFVDADLFKSLLASLTDVFDHVHVYRPVAAALVFVSSDEPIDLVESAPIALAANPESFNRHGIHRVEDFLASWTLDEEGTRALASGAPLNTDDHNRLSTKRLPPPQMRRADEHYEALESLYQQQIPLDFEALQGIDPAAVAERTLWVAGGTRAQHIVKLMDQPEADAAIGWVDASIGRIGRARRSFASALEIDPTHRSATAGLVSLARPDEELPDALLPEERALLEMRASTRSGDWQKASTFDTQVGAIGASRLLFPAAVRARVGWRLKSGDPARGAEAIVLLDELLSRQRTTLHNLLRANAAVQARDETVAWATLEHLASMRLSPSQARQALGLARQLGPAPAGSQAVSWLSQKAKVNR